MKIYPDKMTMRAAILTNQKEIRDALASKGLVIHILIGCRLILCVKKNFNCNNIICAFAQLGISD